MPKQVGVEGYRILGAKNFDDSFVALFTAGLGGGYLDPTVDRGKLTDMPGGNHVRAVFNPDSFGDGDTIDAGLIDNQQFWLQFQPIAGGVEGAVGAPVLILPPAQRYNNARVVIAGEAPNQASVADSQLLVLGSRMTGMSVFNNEAAATSLFVAFEGGGPEVEVLPASNHAYFQGGATSMMWVRGGGAAATFSAEFTVSRG
jgi:hypothetical protein